MKNNHPINSRIPSDAWKYIFRARNDSDDFLIHICCLASIILVICAQIVTDVSFIFIEYCFRWNAVLYALGDGGRGDYSVSHIFSHLKTSLYTSITLQGCVSARIINFHPPGAELFTLLKQVIMILIFTSIRPCMSALP